MEAGRSNSTSARSSRSRPSCRKPPRRCRRCRRRARGRGRRQILTAEEQAEIENFRTKVVVVRKELKDLRKNLRQDSEALVFWTKVGNIALMPLAVALAGLIVAFARRRRQATPA
jgi:hypothetical protein